MNTVPSGSIANRNTLKPPVADATIASVPRCLTSSASANVIADWVARASTIGAASRISARSGAARDMVRNHAVDRPVVQGSARGETRAGDPRAGRARGAGHEPEEDLLPQGGDQQARARPVLPLGLSLIHISEPTRLLSISYAV